MNVTKSKLAGVAVLNFILIVAVLSPKVSPVQKMTFDPDYNSFKEETYDNQMAILAQDFLPLNNKTIEVLFVASEDPIELEVKVGKHKETMYWVIEGEEEDTLFEGKPGELYTIQLNDGNFIVPTSRCSTLNGTSSGELFLRIDFNDYYLNAKVTNFTWFTANSSAGPFTSLTAGDILGTTSNSSMIVEFIEK